MGLKVFKTNTSTEGGRALIARLKEKKEQGRHYFIVPDRFTLSFEQEICKTVFPEGFFNTEVVSFTRFAVKLIGKSLNQCLSKEGTVVLMKRVIAENNERLRYYKDINSYAFSKELFAAIAGLRESGVTVPDINDALSCIGGATAEKLADIAIIYAEYMKALEGKFGDTITRIDALTKNVCKLAELNDAHIYIYGFNIFSQKQLGLIKELIKHCKSVNIAVMWDSGGTNNYLFIKHQAEELAEFCTQNNLQYSERESSELLKEPFYQIHKYLFGYGNKLTQARPKLQARTAVYAEENPYEEIAAAAREINYLVKSLGYRYRDIAVVICNEDYKRIIGEIFSRCGIPYFADTKYPISEGLFYRFIDALNTAVIQKYSANSIFKLAHHPFICLDRESLEAFENHAVSQNINYGAFFKSFGERAPKAETARKIVVDFLNKVPKGYNLVSEYVEYVKNLYESEYIKNKLNECSACGGDRLAAACESEGFISILDECAFLNGGAVVSMEEFVSIYRSAAEGMGKGALPNFADCVFVGNPTDSRFNDIRALFITGAGAGQFPAATGEGTIMTSFDLELLKKNADLKVYPQPADTNALARLTALDIMVKPKDVLYIGYSKAGITGESVAEGEAISELSALLGVKARPLGDFRALTGKEKLLYQLVNAKNAYFQYIRNGVPPQYADIVRKYLEGKSGYAEKLKQAEKEKTDNAPIDYSQYFFKRGESGYNISVSQLESYFRCPYYHYLKYGLKLKEREDGALKVNAVGDIIHRILEDYFKSNKDCLKTAAAAETDANIETSISKITELPEFDGYRNDALGRYTLEGIAEESKRLLKALTAFVQRSSFEPAYIEMEFGRGEGRKITLESGGTEFNFVGKVDRVDTCGDRVAVIDYKTGAVEDDLKYVYLGKKLQLYIYLKVFMDEGKIPTGVFYLPIKSNYIKEGAGYKMVGQISDSTQDFALMDNGYRQDGDYSGDMLDFSIKYVKKYQEYKVQGKNALSYGDFAVIANYAIDISKTALEEIKSGYIERKPFKDSCPRCAYRALCPEVPERNAAGVNGIKSFYGEAEDE